MTPIDRIGREIKETVGVVFNYNEVVGTEMCAATISAIAPVLDPTDINYGGLVLTLVTVNQVILPPGKAMANMFIIQGQQAEVSRLTQ